MSETEPEYDDVPVACTLDESTAERRRDWVEETLLDEIEAIEELGDGYAFTFGGTDEVLEAVSTFVEREAKCCSFARFRIEVPQGFEAVRLRFTGPEGTKALVEEGMVEEFDLAV